MIDSSAMDLGSDDGKGAAGDGWQPFETAPKGTWLLAAEKDPNEDGRGRYDYTYFMLNWSYHTDQWLYYRAGEGWYPVPADILQDITHWCYPTSPAVKPDNDQGSRAPMKPIEE